MAVLRPVRTHGALAAFTLPARAEDRSVLLNRKAMVDRGSKDTGTATAAEPIGCRRILREWALGDARMTVDKQGRPLR